MANATFDRPDLSAFTGLDDLGLEVLGQRVGDDRTVLACKVVGEDRWCRQCGGEGVVRDTVVRRLAHVPYGWHPTMLHVSVRRYRCETCAHVWRQDMSAAADPRVKLSRAAVRWALVGLVVHHLTVARVADVLAVSWNTANTAILGEGQRLLINDPARCEGVRVIGVDEHVWRHTPYGDKYVTVILDLTPIRDRRGPSRLLDMIPGRSKRVFKTWLASQPDTWRERIEIVAMLRHTPLPFLIHDSAIIKLVGHAPVRELLSVYMRSEKLTSRAGEPKQVFFSFDATKAYGQRAEELVEATRVIHLGDGTRALYGFTWNTETTEESN